jgi:hypothetical protein
VYPLWVCVLKCPNLYNKPLFTKERRPINTISHNPHINLTDYLVDIGIYGEPNSQETGKAFKNQRDIGALQSYLGFPSVWGILYINELELSKYFNESYYNELRNKYSANNCFYGIRDKIVFFNKTTPDKGPIKQWRLYRAIKAREYTVLFFIFLLYLFVATILLGIPIYWRNILLQTK